MSKVHETTPVENKVPASAAPASADKPAVKNLKRKEAVLLPSYSIKDLPENTSIFVKIDSVIEERPNMDDDGVQKLDKGKPMVLHLVKVTDLETGERGEMVLPFMIHKAFESFEGESYVGKLFEFIKGKKKGRTNEWTTYELAED